MLDALDALQDVTNVLESGIVILVYQHQVIVKLMVTVVQMGVIVAILVPILVLGVRKISI